MVRERIVDLVATAAPCRDKRPVAIADLSPAGPPDRHPIALTPRIKDCSRIVGADCCHSRRASACGSGPDGQLDSGPPQRRCPYLVRDRRRLLLHPAAVIPVACPSAISPCWLVQAIRVCRQDPPSVGLTGLAVPEAMRLLVFLRLGAVLFRLASPRGQATACRRGTAADGARFRNDLFRHAMELSLRFHYRTPVGASCSPAYQ